MKCEKGSCTMDVFLVIRVYARVSCQNSVPLLKIRSELLDSGGHPCGVVVVSGDYFGSSGQQQGQFNRLGVEEKAQLQMVALRQQEQERLLVEEQVQYTAPGDGAGMRMEERNMAGGAGFQRRQTADYEYQGGR